MHQPRCEACEQETDTRPKAPGSPPPVITFTRGRRRTVDAQAHFCPDPHCSYDGWLRLGNRRADHRLIRVIKAAWQRTRNMIGRLKVRDRFKTLIVLKN